MRNQPKYNFFKNTGYALSGLKDLVQNETSFKLELLIAVILIPVIIFIDLGLIQKLLMFTSLMGLLIAEAINSSIERVVDLVTLDYNKMAGRAKDVGSTIVFLSIVLFIVTWAMLLKELL
ncbi:diacylglycerol kinase [Sulfurimonas sp.]|uniref:diacylglycerol kinase n=1 Tax=Sulfurimonas sp. TaxID=2022749 RepID=UPI0025D86063|nr:diacylglycerol kinase [Sulfurimonas sp.]MCK9473475.1 diacylglycerol kinase [Sulfurimonas sp.]MDD3505325.1 diacylglycerol kinase [Sulfurimonas sp.]